MIQQDKACQSTAFLSVSYCEQDCLLHGTTTQLLVVQLYDLMLSFVQNYDRKLDAEEALEDLRELGLEVRDAKTGNFMPGNGMADSARGKEGAAGYTNGFGNPATMGKPLTGQVATV